MPQASDLPPRQRLISASQTCDAVYSAYALASWGADGADAADPAATPRVHVMTWAAGKL